MSHGRRLITTLLTVNAVLLAGLLWTQVAASPASAGPAPAQLPNAGLQREQIIRQLVEIKKSTLATQKALESGTLRVVIEPPPKKK